MGKKKNNLTKLSEKEKLINFILSMNDKCLVVNTGEKDEEKEFLGYEFSNRRGQEGLHEYEEGSSLYNNDDPLTDDDEKVNFYIKQLFLGQKDFEIPKNLENNVKLIDAVNLFEFERGNRININAKKDFSKSVYPLVKVDKLVSIQKGTAITSDKVIPGNIPVVAGGAKPSCYGNKANRTGPCISIAASGTAGYVSYWDIDIFASDCTTLQTVDKNIELKYLAEYLMRNQEAIYTYRSGSSTPHVYPEDIKFFDIPVPPIDIQQKIIKECEDIDNQVKEKEQIIKDCEDKLNSLYENITGVKTSLSNDKLFAIGGGKRVPKEKRLTSKPTAHPYIRVKDFKENSIDSSKIKYITDDVYQIIKNYTIDSETDIYVSIAGTIGLVGTVPDTLSGANLTENAAFIKCLDVKTVNKMFVMNLLALPKYRALMVEKAATANQPKLSLTSIKNIQIVLPDIETQNKIAEEASDLINEIRSSKIFIEQARKSKNEIIDDYLNK